ncbi:MAG: hypothetical protein H6746_07225 [Deltaproteobacteria bacterium]|nr:hypothetical protein [Deltaproteobacteria bacterium]
MSAGATRMCAVVGLCLGACAPVGSGSGTFGEGVGVDSAATDLAGGETLGDDADAVEISGGDADGAEISGGDADGAETSGGDADTSETAGGDADASETAGGDADAVEDSGDDADALETSGGDADGAEISGGDADAIEISGDDADVSETSGGDADATAPSCVDEEQNGDETDVDCGGSCDPCPVDKACSGAADCQSATCAAGVCVAAEACKDKVENGNETDVDCGGGECLACATGKYCVLGSDCLSATCIFGVCENPTCEDDHLNQGESDIDCGGAKCPACADGAKCGMGSDCESGACEGGLCVSCDDEALNGDETDVDCGGGCAPCGVGEACGVGGDCETGLCAGGSCCVPNACGGCGVLGPDLCDGVNSDCDGDTDEDSDTESPPGCALTLGVCAGVEPECAGVAGWVCDTSTYAKHDPAYEAEESSCDGLDNDCDGGTDEGLEPPLCASQKGVCAGARAECGGLAGWVCDALVYGAHSDAYEATEQTCDGIDNDCDGATDEGLLNACGECGPLPVETCDGVDNDCDGITDAAGALGPAPACDNQEGVCAGSKAVCAGLAGWVCDGGTFAANDARWEADESQCDGLDNDCDGSTDERAECSVCGGSPVVVADSKSTYHFPHGNQFWQGTVLIATGHAQSGTSGKTARYHKVGDAGVSSYAIPVSNLEFTDGPTVAANSSFAHIFGGLGDETHYARYNGSGSYSKKGFTVADYVTGDSNIPVVAGSNYHIGVLHRDASADLAYVDFDAATWDVVATTGGNLNRASLAVDRGGRAYALIRTSAGLRLWDIMPPSGTPKMETVAGTGINPVRVQVAQTAADLDEVHVVYQDGNTYYYRSRIGGEWSTPHEIVTTPYSSNIDLTLDPLDRPVISESDGATDTIYVHRLIEGTWKKTMLVAPDSDIFKPTVFVDTLGRHRVVYWANGVGGGVMHQFICKDSIGKPEACVPSCAGDTPQTPKVCGDDGCGGSCGSCGPADTCIAGSCVNAPQCGANLALTCSGRCGSYEITAGCQCDALCVTEGDCCLDLDACCGP